MEEVINNFSQRICDELVKRLKELGDTESLELFNEYKRDKQRFHDTMQGFANIILGYVQKYGGDEVVWKNMQDRARFGYPPFINKYIEAFEKGEVGPEDFPLEEFLINRAKVWEKNYDNLQTKKDTLILD